MGPLATARFYERFVERSGSKRDQDHPSVYIAANPKIPDRTGYIEGVGSDPFPAILEEARRLELCGVDLIVVPCNSAALFGQRLASEASVPVIDWAGCAVDEVASREWSRVGLLATRGTIAAGVYQARFASRGVDAVVPDDRCQALIMDAIYGPEGVKTMSAVTPAGVELLSAAAAKLVAEGAEGLLIACTELPVITADAAWDPGVPIVDAGEAAIGACLEQLGALTTDMAGQ